MTTFTIVIPTHDHADTLRYSVSSVQWQTCQDFELFIIGDGVPDQTRVIAAALCAEDSRIRFFDLPKGERHGELHRHHALREAKGRFVAYQSDDDLWLPEHLASLAVLLEYNDLVHCMQMLVKTNGELHTWMYDAHSDPLAIEKMRRSNTGFGLGSGAHRLDAYHRLPKGWHPAPKGIATDHYFWLQFLDQSWCRYYSYKWPNALHLSSVERKGWSLERRVEELDTWWNKIQSPSQRNAYVKQCLVPLHDEMYKENSHGTVDSELSAEIRQLSRELNGGYSSHTKLHSYTFGEELSFRQRGNADNYLMTECFYPTQWGRWTLGALTNLILPLKAAIVAQMQLDLEIRPFLHPVMHPVCAFSVHINGVMVLNVHETRAKINRYTVMIPQSILDNLATLALSFIVQSPIRPVDLGLSSDTRLIGLGLVSLRLSVAGNAET